MSEEIKETEVVSEEAEEVVVEPTAEENETNETKEETIGNIKIAVDVVSTIAGIAATEIDGVNCMYSSFVNGFAQKLGAKKNTSKGVKVEMDGNNASIDIYIVVDYGVKIPELAWSVQENVKNSVEAMTGMNVVKVNIHIEGINFESDTSVSDADEVTE